jgi:hypothetical protein
LHLSCGPALAKVEWLTFANRIVRGIVMKSIGSKLLFGVTLGAFLAIGALSFLYNNVHERNLKIAEMRGNYEKRIADLKSKLVVEQTQTIKLQTPTFNKL